ncbi:MAG TPA: DUF4185 domain-containing protein [Flavisolibacter sp.]|jgi:hypothetical protein|nr:DUF4185 domain-containing protein [Flavisolibacter sp.]
MRLQLQSIGLVSLLLLSCTQQLAPVKALGPESINFRVVEAPEWTALFQRTSGWVGADGIFSIPLNGVDSSGGAKDTSTLFVFSDTVFGEIEDGAFSTGFGMINNSVAVLRGAEPDREQVTFHWKVTAAGKPQSVFIPQKKESSPSDYFWLGDGFVNPERNGDIYLFAYRIQNTKAKVFAFKEVGNTLLVIPSGARPPFDTIRQFDTELFFQKDSVYNGSLGAGLLFNNKASGALRADDYLYVYGVLGSKKDVVVARVKPAAIEEWNQWRFWDGKGWNKDKNEAAPIADRASNELSVTPLPDGRYAMIFQLDGISNTIGMRLGSSPAGPFGPIIPVWDCSADTKVDKDFFTYNAKAHPGLSKKGELLISYNINSFDALNDLKERPDHYRPRFVKIIWEEN